MVGFQYRFVWASCGYPDNSHDAIIYQSTNLYQEITENSVRPLIGQNKNGAVLQLLVLGDAAFQFSTWLMKPYTNAMLSKEQGYFNYWQSRARMVFEEVYGS